MRKWTIMVYLAGDNNLDGAGVADLTEMKKAGSNGDVAVVAQFDRSGPKNRTKRYFLRKGGSLAADVVGDLGETNTGDPKVLEDFILWGARTYPAGKYMVVIWNHGSGWDDENVYRVSRALKRNIVGGGYRSPGRTSGLRCPTALPDRFRTAG